MVGLIRGCRNCRDEGLTILLFPHVGDIRKIIKLTYIFLHANSLKSSVDSILTLLVDKLNSLMQLEATVLHGAGPGPTLVNLDITAA